MRPSIVVLAGIVVLGATGAAATPLTGGWAGAKPDNSLATAIHHKPGHRGGPPWTRDRDRREDSYREPYRETYQRPTYRRQVCRTTYRESYDPYEGAYVSRPVRVCRSEY